MARTKSSTSNTRKVKTAPSTKSQAKSKVTKAPIARVTSSPAPSPSPSPPNQISSALQKEHEDDVHEALLCILQTKRIPKKQMLLMAKYGGIENHVASTLDKVRGEAIDDDDAENKMGDESKSTKKKTDFYDPSILASPCSATSDQMQEEQNRLLFEEVIDLARGGMGGQFTRTLKRKKKRKGQSRSKRKKKKDHSKSMKIHNPPQRRMRRKRKRLHDDKDDETEKQCAKRRLVARSGSLNTLPVSPRRPRREKQKQSRITNALPPSPPPPPPPHKKKRKMICDTKRCAQKSMYSALGSIPPPRQPQQTQLVLNENDKSITPRPISGVSRKSNRRQREGGKEKEKKKKRERGCKGAAKWDGNSQGTKGSEVHPVKISDANDEKRDVRNRGSCDSVKSKGHTAVSTDSDGEDEPSLRSIVVTRVISKGERLCTSSKQGDSSGSIGRTVDMKLKRAQSRRKAAERKRVRKGKGQQNSLCALFNE